MRGVRALYLRFPLRCQARLLSLFQPKSQNMASTTSLSPQRADDDDEAERFGAEAGAMFY